MVHTASSPTPPACLTLGLRLSAVPLSVCRLGMHRPPASLLCIEGAATLLAPSPCCLDARTPYLQAPQCRPRVGCGWDSTGKAASLWDRAPRPQWSPPHSLGCPGGAGRLGGNCPSLPHPQRLLEESDIRGARASCRDWSQLSGVHKTGKRLGGRVIAGMEGDAEHVQEPGHPRAVWVVYRLCPHRREQQPG